MQRSWLGLLEWPMRSLMRRYRTARYLYDLVETLDEQAADHDASISAPLFAALRAAPLTYVDVGARGGLSPSLSRFREILKVVMFEPDPDEAARLQHECQPSDTVVISAAVSDRTSRQVIYLTRKRGNSSIFPPRGHTIGLTAIDGEGLARYSIDSTVEVDTRRLDESLAVHGLSAEILKIDTQGSEWQVIQGLGDHRPYLIVVECATTEIYEGQTTIWKIGAHLESLGYFPARLMRRHAVPSVDGRHRSSIQLYGDVVFVPDLSATGRSLICRNPTRWLASLTIHGLADLAHWQAGEAEVDLASA